MQKRTVYKYFTPLNLIYFALGLVLLFVLLLQVDLDQLLKLMTGIQPGFLILGGMIYFLKSAMRAVRFWRINMSVKPSYLKMLRLTFASSLASQLMPLKIGELAYIYLVKKEFRLSLPQGISSLMIVRIYDMLAISLLFLLTCLGFGLQENFSSYFYYVLGFVGFLVIFLMSMVSAGRFLLRIANTMIQRTFIHKIQLSKRLMQGAEHLLNELSRFNRKESIELVIYPLIEWVINFWMYHVLLLGLGFTPHILDTVIGVAFAALMSILPVNSFGNFGTQEAGWATGLMLAGYSQEVALLTGFATHLLSLGYLVILGGAAWVLFLTRMVFQRAQQPSRPEV